MMPGHWLPLRKNNLQRRLPANRRSVPTPFPLQTDLNQSKITPPQQFTGRYWAVPDVEYGENV